MSDRKPPRDDDRTPPAGTASRRFPSSPLGQPIVGRAVTERGGGYAGDRDTQGVRRRDNWDEDEKTPPTSDPEIYRAVRDLRSKTESQSGEIADIKEGVKLVDRKTDQQTIEIAVIKSTQQIHGAQQEKLEKIVRTELAKLNNSVVRVATLVEANQNKVTLSETTSTATVEGDFAKAMEGVLAKQVLDQEDRKQKLRETLWVKIVGGIFGGSAITAMVAGVVAIIQGKC